MTATHIQLTNWQTSLITQSAIIENGAVMHFGNAKKELIATTNSNVLCDLSHLGLLEISGDDAVSFLQGQVTNDVKLLAGTNAHYSAYCNPKGRMLALFLAFAHYDHLHLQFNRTLLEPIMKRLKMYVMRSQVNIKDVSEDIINIGINGPEAAQILASSLPQIPSEDYQLITLENATILKMPSINNHARFQIFTNADNAPKIWNVLKEKCEVVGKPCWDWLEIQAGIPDIELKTQEQFVPQMLNLDLLNGINFKKGCYTGQEIVARTHYLGSVKRRTYLAELDTISAADIMPSAGDKVMDGNKNEVGQIVRVTVNTNNGYDALIELRIEATLTENLSCDGNTIKLKQLPYSL